MAATSLPPDAKGSSPSGRASISALRRQHAVSPTLEADLDRVVACTVTEPIGWIPADRHRAGLADGEHRPEWTWIAESDHETLARAIWAGFPHHEHSRALDCVWGPRVGRRPHRLAAGS